MVVDRLFHVIEEGTGSTDLQFEDFIQTNEGETVFIAEYPWLRRVLADNDDINLFLPLANYYYRDLAYHKETGDIWILFEKDQFIGGGWGLIKLEPDNISTFYNDIDAEYGSEILIDSAGLVWIGISDGFLSFNPETEEKITHFSAIPIWYPVDIQLGPDQTIWYYWGHQIFKFDGIDFLVMASYGQSTDHFFSSFTVNEDGLFYAIAKHSSGDDHLLRFSQDFPDGEIMEIPCLPENAEMYDVQFGQHGELWVSCRRSVQLPTETQWGTTQAVYYNGEWICSETTDWLEESYEVEPVIYPHYQEGVYMPIKNYADVENHPVISRHIWLDGISGTAHSEKQDFSMSVFPNPSGGEISVFYNLASTSEVAIKVFDCTGRQIFQQNLAMRLAGNHTETLDLKQMTDGLYVVEVVSQDKRQSQRVVISR